MSGTASVRELMLGAPGSRIPPFRMLLAPGWIAEHVSSEQSAATASAISARLRSEQRPDLDAQLAPMLRQADDRLRRIRAFATLRQEREVDGFFAPMTIALTEHDSGGDSLDAQVEALVAKRGAEPLRGDLRMLRWVVDAARALGGEPVRTRTVSYLTPVPGTRHAKALLVVATIVLGADTPGDHPLLVGSVDLADAMLATFDWQVSA